MSPNANSIENKKDQPKSPEESEPVAKKQKLNIEEEKLLELVEKKIEIEGEKKLPAKVIGKESGKLEEGEVEELSIEEKKGVFKTPESIAENKAKLGETERRSFVEQELIKVS